MDLKLKGKNVLLFGGHSNIGRAVSHEFAKEGACITIACRDTETGNKVAKEALDLGAPRAEVIKCDATHYHETKAAADYALSFGDIDIVYHGIMFDTIDDFFELDPALWDQEYEVNLKAPMNAWHYILPIMKKQGHGNFVNIASTMGRIHPHLEPVYGAMKAAMIHLSQTLAIELGQYGIRINLVGTGPTPPTDPSLLSKGSQFHGFIKNANKHPDYGKELLQMTPLKQFGTGLDTALAVLYLASDVTGRHLTGQIVGTDGGIYMSK